MCTLALGEGDNKEGKTMYIITDECIGCGLCQANCPVSAIGMGEEHRVIDQSVCVQCGTCFEACPVEAIEEQE